ncbi:DUF3566 domain-containing protein [Nocardioides sambongensis]|uniref:DUF3566 domain-containing protein n=1 Tax=Nocardioides sambongensis TaxID=2589074 RepID=UPI001E2CD60F|nr:DUF3566 domain-containing protein [Nocardioides sambongensis]
MTDRVDETTIRTDGAETDDARTAEVPTVKSGDEKGADSDGGADAGAETGMKKESKKSKAAKAAKDPAAPTKPAPSLPPPPTTAPLPASAGGPAAAEGPVEAPKPAPAATRPVRRARLRLTRVDPWSVMKTAFLLSIAFAVVTVVAVAMVWQVLGAAGVWDSINSTIQESIGGEDVQNFQIEDYVGTSRVLGFTMLVAAIDVVLLTAAATLTAFLYNMSAALLGGVEVTLAEDH